MPRKLAGEEWLPRSGRWEPDLQKKNHVGSMNRASTWHESIVESASSIVLFLLSFAFPLALALAFSFTLAAFFGSGHLLLGLLGQSRDLFRG